MKKDRKSRKKLIELYYFFDNYYSDFTNEELISLSKKYANRYGHPAIWTEFYGCFKNRNNRIVINYPFIVAFFKL